MISVIITSTVQTLLHYKIHGTCHAYDQSTTQPNSATYRISPTHPSRLHCKINHRNEQLNYIIRSYKKRTTQTERMETWPVIHSCIPERMLARPELSRCRCCCCCCDRRRGCPRRASFLSSSSCPFSPCGRRTTCRRRARR